MLAPSYSLTSTERALPRLALDFTTALLDPRVTFTRTTGASNPATYINSSGVITAATNNQPRFDYDPVTLVCKGLLIEESRTNALLNSDTLSTQSVTVTAAARTLSFYGTGQIVLSGAHSSTVTGTGAYPTRTTLTFTPSAGTLTLTVTGTVQYAQLEAGAFATSYIPTTTTALTRNADVATMTGTNFSDWFKQTEGAFELEYSRIANGVAGKFPYAAYVFQDAQNRIDFYQNATTNDVVTVKTANVNVASFARSVVGANVTVNQVLAYKTNSFAFASGGSSVSTSSSGNLPSPTVLYIGGINSTGFELNGHMKKINYWPLRITNSEVQSFSK